MKKSMKMAIAMALVTGVTAGSTALTNTASAEISDNFRLEVNGVSSFFHDTDHVYYGQTRTDNTGLGKGWNNYTRVQFTYKIDKDTRLVARLHSNYDNAGDFAANSNQYGSYFDQSFIQFDDPKSNMHYIIGKKGMTLGQSMVYNSTGNLTGIQVSYGNFWDPTCLQFTYGDAKGGNRVISAQLTQEVAKNVSMNATWIRGESLYNNSNNKNYTDYIKQHDNFIDFGAKATMPGISLVGEWAKNNAHMTQHGEQDSKNKRGWFLEAFTGPTNDFGSGLPVQKVGTHVFSVRYQDLGKYGSYVHNNTFYDGKRGIRFDYGMTIKKGMSIDFVYGRMKAKNDVSNGTKNYGNGHNVHKGDWSNIFVASLNYKFR